MPKFAVTLADGRVINCYAPDETGAKKQATHQETSRIVIAAKRGQEITVPASIPFSVEKIKN